MFLRPESKSKKIPCRMLYGGPFVLASGAVTACGCRDLEGNSELALGHIDRELARQTDQRLDASSFPGGTGERLVCR